MADCNEKEELEEGTLFYSSHTPYVREEKKIGRDDVFGVLDWLFTCNANRTAAPICQWYVQYGLAVHTPLFNYISFRSRIP